MMNKRVVGLDISRNFAVGFLLDYYPDSPPMQVFNQLKKTNLFRFENDVSGVKLLLSLNPDLIILEPTGYWYSQFWVEKARQNDIDVAWVSHQSVKWSRKHYKFKNKNDDSDAFTIALMYFDITGYDDFGNPPLLKRYDSDLIDQVRRVFYEREQIVKHRNILISQLRQRLEVEFPEIAKRDFLGIGKSGFNPTLGHLTEKCVNRRFPRETVGLGVQSYSLELAEDIIRDQSRILSREDSLSQLMYRFPEYNQVFNQFCYGIVLKSLLLLHCYPIERFMLADGKPYRKNGHDQSLRQFQHFLGLGFTYEKSGDTSAKDNKVKKSWSGSDIVRSHLYAHCLVTTCRRTFPAKTPTMLLLKDAWFNERVRDVIVKDNLGNKKEVVEKFPAFKSLGKDGICRLLFYETRLLYSALKRNCL